MKCVANIPFDLDEELALDLYLPDNLNAKACVIYAHGGGFRKGSKGEELSRHFAKRLTDIGFAVASVDYRLRCGFDSFSDDEAEQIRAFLRRGQRLGLRLSSSLYGPAFIAAMIDISKAVEFLWVEGKSLGIGSRKTGILGVSAGGIAGLALAYPPGFWRDKLAKPDAVVAISSAIVQPWQLKEDGPPCLMINSPIDRIVPMRDAARGAARAQNMGAPVTLINTGIKGHNTQVDLALDGVAQDGTPYMQIIADQFARLVD